MGLVSKGGVNACLQASRVTWEGAWWMVHGAWSIVERHLADAKAAGQAESRGGAAPTLRQADTAS